MEINGELVKEMSGALRGVQDAMISLKKDAERDREEVKAMVGRLTEEIKRLFSLVRDGGEGRRALVEEVQDCKRDIADMKAGRLEFRQEVSVQFKEIENKLEAIEQQLATGAVYLKVEKVRGLGLIVASLLTALAGAASAIAIAILK